MLRVRATVWVEGAVPEVSVATILTWEVAMPPFPFALPLVPQLDRPAAKTHVDASNR
jgi:hypothetical protein